MQKKTVSSTGTNISGLAARVGELYNQALAVQRGASMPKVGVVASFDPDQKGFLTDAMQGLTNVQIGNGSQVTNVLAAHADFGVSPMYQNPDLGTGIFPFKAGRKLQPAPGQPTPVYPVASANGSVAASFIRGGKAQPYREYPGYAISRNFPAYYLGSGIGSLCYVRPDSLVFNKTQGIDNTTGWYSNSPLPPGMRWVELNDLRYENTNGTLLALGQLISISDLAALIGVPLADINKILPQDLDGNIRTNCKPLPSNKWALHPEILGNDTYWTGTVRNPLDWVDAWWYGNNHNIDKDAMETWLEAHRGARFP